MWLALSAENIFNFSSCSLAPNLPYTEFKFNLLILRLIGSVAFFLNPYSLFTNESNTPLPLANL